MIVSFVGLTGLARAQVDPVPPLPQPIGESLEGDEPDIFGLKKLKLLQKPQDELEALKVERYLAAWEQLKFLLPRFRERDVYLRDVVAAAQLVIDSQLAITESETDRLSLLEQNAEFWKQIEYYERRTYETGAGTRSEYYQAKVHYLTAQIAVVEFERAMKTKKPVEPNASTSVSPPAVQHFAPAPATCAVCPTDGRRFPRRLRW